MNSIDEQIRKALSEEDQRLFDEIDDQPGLFEMIGMVFAGKQAWMSYYMWAMWIIVVVAGLYFLQQYANTSDIKLSLSWAVAVIGCLHILTIIKVIGWRQMQKIELMREIKRIEMRVMASNSSNRKT